VLDQMLSACQRAVARFYPLTHVPKWFQKFFRGTVRPQVIFLGEAFNFTRPNVNEIHMKTLQE
jgi:hypothetical protein